MKSAAFNLAFQVHRNEIPFQVGLLRSNEEGVASDFLEALNSLAGEIKYDPSQLASLIEGAQAGIGGGRARILGTADLKAVEEEIRALRDKQRDIEEGIRTLKVIAARTEPTITPGVNSILVLIVFSVLVALLFIFDLPLVALPAILIGLIAAVVVFMNDSKVLRQQEAEARRRRAKNEQEIGKLESSLEEVHEQVEAKQSQLQSTEGETPSPPDLPGPL